MNKFLISCCLLIGLVKVCGQEARLDTIHYSGPIENRINYVILGDGYVVTQLDDFLADAQQASGDLFDDSPFDSYQNYFNVFSVFVPSNIPGAALDPNNLIDNQFGSTFNFAGIERLLVPTRTERVVDVLVENFPEYDQVIMLVNTERYGGSGGWLATSSVHEAAGEIVRHEIGHSFADLADEYWAGLQYARETYNMTRESSANVVRWKNWYGDFGIGIYSYPANPTWYKPHNSCKMEALDNRFCAVCIEQLVRVFHELVNPIDNFSPVQAITGNEPIRFEIQPLEPLPNSLKIQWTVGEEIIARNTYEIEVDPADFHAQGQELQVSVIDTTEYDRKNSVYISTIIWSLGTEITSTTDRFVEEKVDQVLTAQVTDQRTMTMEVFPNPTTDFVSIVHDSSRPEMMKVEIMNMKGQVLDHSEIQKLSNSSEPYAIDMSKYPSGIYFLKVRTNTFEHSFKLIKK